MASKLQKIFLVFLTLRDNSMMNQFNENSDFICRLLLQLFILKKISFTIDLKKTFTMESKKPAEFQSSSEINQEIDVISRSLTFDFKNLKNLSRQVLLWTPTLTLSLNIFTSLVDTLLEHGNFAFSIISYLAKVRRHDLQSQLNTVQRTLLKKASREVGVPL